MVSESTTLKYGFDAATFVELWNGNYRIPGNKLNINAGTYGANQGIRQASFEKDTGNDEPTLGQVFVTSEEADTKRVQNFGKIWRESRIAAMKRSLIGKDGHVPFKPFLESLQIGKAGNAKDPVFATKQFLRNNALPEIEDLVMKVMNNLMGGKPTELCFSSSKQGGTGELVRLVLMYLFYRYGWDDIPFTTNITAIKTRISEQEKHTSRMQLAYSSRMGFPFTDLVFLTDDSNLVNSRLKNELIIDQKTLDDLVVMSFVAIHGSHKRCPEALESSDVLRSLIRQARTKIVVPLVLTRTIPRARRTFLDRIRRGKSNRLYDALAKELEQELCSSLVSLRNYPKVYIRAEIFDEEFKFIPKRSVPVTILGGYLSREVVLSAWDRSRMPHGWTVLPLPYPSKNISVVAWYPLLGAPKCFSRIFGYEDHQFREIKSPKSILPKPMRIKYAKKFRPIISDLLATLHIEEGAK